jgi:hypothetical protein
MDEKEWLEFTDPFPMLEFLRGKASDRKLRLFGCACCRRVWHLLTDEKIRRAVEVLERYGDGLAGREELRRVVSEVDELFGFIRTELRYNEGSASPEYAVLVYAVLSALMAADMEVEEVLRYTLFASRPLASDLDRLAKEERQPALDSADRRGKDWQSNLFRDLFGNPFRPVALDPTWLTPTVKALARAIYDDRTFADLPVLADALEEAGCTNVDILNHCRQPGEHARGCWVLDLALGKV